MILGADVYLGEKMGKPRASGDDPRRRNDLHVLLL